MFRNSLQFLTIGALWILAVSSSRITRTRIKAPELAHGHLRYDFYLLNDQGSLQLNSLTLQEVQNMLLNEGVEEEEQENDTTVENQVEDGTENALSLLWKVRGQPPDQNSIDAVLSNVQKVMSSEMNDKLPNEHMSSYYEEIFKESQNSSEMESTTEEILQDITIPATIIANLIKDKVSSLETHSPWTTTSYIPLLYEYEATENNKIDKDMATETTTQSNMVDHEDEELEIPKYDATTKPFDDDLYKDNDKNESNATDFSENDPSVTTPKNIDEFESQVTKMTDPEEMDHDDQNTEAKDATTHFEITPTEDEKEIEKTTMTEETLDSSDAAFIADGMTTATQYEEPTEPTESWELLKTKISGSEDIDPPSYNLVPIEKLGEEEQFSNSLITADSGNEKEISALDLDPNIEPIPEPEPTASNGYADSDTRYNAFIDSIQTGNEKDYVAYEDYESPIDKYAYQYEEAGLAVQPQDKPTGFVGEVQKKKVTNVLDPSEIAPVSVDNLVALDDLSGKDNGNHEYDFDEPQYLEDLPPIDYQYSQTNSEVEAHPKPPTNPDPFDFPSPDVANSYHQPDHVLSHQAKPGQQPGQTHGPQHPYISNDLVDPTQFLPAFNPELAKGENPLQPTPEGNKGLEGSSEDLSPFIKEFIDDTNELSLKIYKDLAKIHRRQNMIVCPLNLISSLSMLRIGSRNATADALSEVLMANDSYIFNPHLEIKKITDELLQLNGQKLSVGIVNSLFISKPKRPHNMEIFTRTLEYFYDTMVKEINPEEMGKEARDHANAKMREQTINEVEYFLKPEANLKVLGPLSIVSSAYFQSAWDVSFGMEDLIDMNFIRFPSAERRLIKTVGIQKRMKIMAGYTPKLDATIAEVPLSSPTVSLLVIMPGRQKSFIANGLSQLEQSLTAARWKELLRAPILHDINFKMPVFSHRNYLNMSSTFVMNGLEEIFSSSADFSGINGAKNLRVGDIVQLTEFHSIKMDLDKLIRREGKQFDFSHSDRDLPTQKKLLKIRQKRADTRQVDRTDSGQEDPSRFGVPKGKPQGLRDRRSQNTLAYDRAFFYVLRHNPTGLILFIGRYLDPETF